MSFSNVESSGGNRDPGEQIKSGRHPGPGGMNCPGFPRAKGIPGI